jgi:hypothetical protein
MDFTPTGTPSSEQLHPQQATSLNSNNENNNNSFHSHAYSQISNDHSATKSSSTTQSQDKKPRATVWTPLSSGFGISTEERYGYSDSSTSKVGTNPFLATTLQERDENFPSFEEALLTTSGDSILNENSSTSCIGVPNTTANLSISALAALSEHNRHVSRYGIDNSMLQDQEDDDDDDDDATFPQSLYADPLDIEWERLLQNTSQNNSAVNLSHISLNQSLQSVPEHLLSDDKIRVTTIRTPDGVEHEAIEVMTEASYSDFLNTSRMIDVLRTPEHVRIQAREENVPSEVDGVTIRVHRDIHSSTYPTSEASFSDDSTRKLQKLYLRAMLPPIASHHRQSHDSSSMTSTPSQNSKSIDLGYNAATVNSFSLHNVDLSRISADDDDESGIIRNLDQSFGTTNTNDHCHILPSLTDHFDIGIHIDNDQTPSTSNNKNRKAMTRPRFKEYTPSSSTPSEQQNWWNDSPSQTRLSPHKNNTPTRDSTQRPFATEQSRSVLHTTNDDDAATDRRLEMMGLSPISRQAADAAISLLQSSPDWNRATTTPQNRNAQLSYPNPFDTEAYPEFLPYTNESSTDHPSSESDRILHNIVEYEQTQLCHSTTSSESQLHSSNEGGFSPLHSSSEPNNNNDSGNSGVEQRSSESDRTSNDVSKSIVLENSNSSDDHLKKNSLSSISPNSSSEHHITTKPTTTTNSVSSYSATSENSKQNTSLPLPLRKSSKRSQSVKLPSTTEGAGTQHTVPQWDDQNDRRQYRTVVPIRVFIDEPYHFPNEDDSFSSISRKLSVLSLPKLSRGSNGIQKRDRSERSVRSDPR